MVEKVYLDAWPMHVYPNFMNSSTVLVDVVSVMGDSLRWSLSLVFLP